MGRVCQTLLFNLCSVFFNTLKRSHKIQIYRVRLALCEALPPVLSKKNGFDKAKVHKLLVERFLFPVNGSFYICGLNVQQQ